MVINLFIYSKVILKEGMSIGGAGGGEIAIFGKIETKGIEKKFVVLSCLKKFLSLTPSILLKYSSSE